MPDPHRPNRWQVLDPARRYRGRHRPRARGRGNSQRPDRSGISAAGSSTDCRLRRGVDPRLAKAKAAWFEAARAWGKPIPTPRYRPAIYQSFLTRGWDCPQTAMTRAGSAGGRAPSSGTVRWLTTRPDLVAISCGSARAAASRRGASTRVAGGFRRCCGRPASAPRSGAGSGRPAR